MMKELIFSLLQICSASNEVMITNDGATILKQLEVIHPCAKMVSTYPITIILSVARSFDCFGLKIASLCYSRF